MLQFSVHVQVAKKPSSLSHTQAASIPYVAGTTFTALRLGCLNEKNARNKKLDFCHLLLTNHYYFVIVKNYSKPCSCVYNFCITSNFEGTKLTV